MPTKTPISAFFLIFEKAFNAETELAELYELALETEIVSDSKFVKELAFGAWENIEKIDAMIEKAEQTLDSEARTQLLSDICTKINEKSLMVSLYTTTYVRAYNSDLQGMDCSAAGYTMYQDLYWAE